MKIQFIVVCVLGILSPTAAVSSCMPDLGLVVDTTKSLGQEIIPILKEAIYLLLQEFDISADKTHVSLETFSKKAKVHNKFNDPTYWSVDAVLDLVNTSISKLKSPTHLDFALKEATDTMFTEANGDRPGERNVLVVFTDGRTHDSTDFQKLRAYIKDLKSKGVRLVAVAIGPDSSRPESRRVLNEIGGENVFYIADYQSIPDTVKDVVDFIYQSIPDAVQDIVDLICPPNPCDGFATDVAFLVDRTNSVGISNFKMLKGFLLELSDAMPIGPDAAHVGYILFAKQANLLNTFADTEYYSRENVHSLITSIPNKLFGSTFIDRALIKANDSLFTPMGGNRLGASNVLILMTDGRTNRDSISFSEIVPSLRDDKQVRMIALGVGNYRSFMSELREIAGDNVYTAANFDELSDLFNEILVESCSIDGGFSDWSDWSDCKDGRQERTRTCTNPPPHGNGKKCEGDLKETRQCLEKRSLKDSDAIDAKNSE